MRHLGSIKRRMFILVDWYMDAEETNAVHIRYFAVPFLQNLQKTPPTRLLGQNIGFIFTSEQTSTPPVVLYRIPCYISPQYIKFIIYAHICIDITYVCIPCSRVLWAQHSHSNQTSSHKERTLGMKIIILVNSDTYNYLHLIEKTITLNWT